MNIISITFFTLLFNEIININFQVDYKTSLKKRENMGGNQIPTLTIEKIYYFQQ